MLDSVKFIGNLYLFSAAGLYYLAELIEEYSIIAKKAISYSTFVSVLISSMNDGSIQPLLLFIILLLFLHA